MARSLFGPGEEVEGASTDLRVLWSRLRRLALPYFTAEESRGNARLYLVAVVLLTLAGTGMSVWFSFLGRDFFNALSEKDVVRFWHLLYTYLGAFAVGIPLFIFRDYVQSKMHLDWRQWMTRKLLREYLSDKSYYRIQQGSLIDNPDQRLTSDINSFTSTTISVFMTIFASVTDLISFSGILFQIYPPLFAALFIYAIGGTALSLRFGRPLVPLNFRQEKVEADLRYSLVRVRENAESVAFFGGETLEEASLATRLQRAVENMTNLMVVSRNLNFFTSFYRYIIVLLPTAVVAPLFFSGKIELGVVTQSNSAFSHILSDVSLVVYQLELLAGFSATIDRLGEFTETIEQTRPEGIEVREEMSTSSELVRIVNLSLQSPEGANGKSTDLVQNLNLRISQGDRVIIMGPSGVGKTTLLRSLAGLWPRGSGTIHRFGSLVVAGGGGGDIFFVPQRPYLPLGSLRDLVLYPTWQLRTDDSTEDTSGLSTPILGWVKDSLFTLLGTKGYTKYPLRIENSHSGSKSANQPIPNDEQIRDVLESVGLRRILDRLGERQALDVVTDWSSVLSIGEQQRISFARVLLAKPQIVLMDESTSALDTDNEKLMYDLLDKSDVSFVSVGHRPSLTDFHDTILRLESDGRWEVKPLR
jgi:ABC-type uncharacterized transport system fused permease/ATPase subunit